MNAISPNTTNLQSDSFVTPLLMYQPMNLIVLLTFYSPIIIALGVLSMSFIFQNFKGFIYLGFLLSVSVAREFLLMISGATQKVSANRVCDMAQYSKYGNTGFSIFAITFTLFYICMPMFLNKDVNWWVFGGLLFYLLMDIGIRYMKQCITQVSDILLNLVTGAAVGLLIPGLLYVGGSSKYLFFNEISSTKEICSMPKKQNFKCAVYRNGELIGSA
jgi:hypothetical protein